MMICITLIFVSLYAAALFGWLRPLSDVTMITRLEPIIFVIAGYYFGRLPGQTIEGSLKEEIVRQSQRTYAMQHAKELAEKERDTIEERAKNARLALGAALNGVPDRLRGAENARTAQIINGTYREPVMIAAKILDS
jgi:hypothetical protein